jgi:endoglucanase
MKTFFLSILLFISANTLSFGQSNNLQAKFLTDSLETIEKRVEKLIIPTRYMAQKLIAETDTIKGWENVKVSLYEYSVNKGEKVGKVYMANADAKKLATWIITTCVILTNKLDKENTDFLIKSIRNASGGQFAVKGIVYENMDGKGYYPYVFKDGVTVYLKETTADDLSLITNENIRKTGKYARIISTNREQFNTMYPGRNTDELEWLNVIREEYKLALQSDKNNLIIAWANGKLK